MLSCIIISFVLERRKIGKYIIVTHFYIEIRTILKYFSGFYTAFLVLHSNKSPLFINIVQIQRNQQCQKWWVCERMPEYKLGAVTFYFYFDPTAQWFLFYLFHSYFGWNSVYPIFHYMTGRGIWSFPILMLATLLLECLEMDFMGVKAEKLTLTNMSFLVENA